jgi:hypothetical protein
MDFIVLSQHAVKWKALVSAAVIFELHKGSEFSD